jgi:hypothetical protein
MGNKAPVVLDRGVEFFHSYQEHPCHGLALAECCCIEMELDATAPCTRDQTPSLHLPQRLAGPDHALCTVHYILELQDHELRIPNFLTLDQFVLEERLS